MKLKVKLLLKINKNKSKINISNRVTNVMKLMCDGFKFC